MTKKKKPLDQSEPVAPVNSESDKSDEFLNFDQAMRTIMTMPEKRSKKDPRQVQPKGKKAKKAEVLTLFEKPSK